MSGIKEKTVGRYSGESLIILNVMSMAYPPLPKQVFTKDLESRENAQKLLPRLYKMSKRFSGRV